MTTFIPEMSTFLLVDNAMLTAGDSEVIAAGDRPDWLACLYDDQWATVSPYLIDLHAAYEAGKLDGVMAILNAIPAKLHVSFIETHFSRAELAHHLRRFIMVRCAGRKNLTLRFADCAVLPQLAIALTAEQWAALVSPMTRWHVHGYDGKLLPLPGADAETSKSATPLVLTEQQLAALDAAMLPNKVLGCLRAMRHGATLPGGTADQYRWASESCQLWRNAGNAPDIALRWLTDAALETQGAVLHQKPVVAMLIQSDLNAIRAGLHAAVEAHAGRVNRTGERP